MERDVMLQKLMEMDFIATDLGLYLNTHPEETEAITAYRQVIAAAETLRAKFEAAYGPLCSFRSDAQEGDTSWQWKNDPWPWQLGANPSLAGKESM